MELKDFVKNAIVEISQGVLEAKEALKDSGVLINPMTTGGNVVRNPLSRQLQHIEMNVAVTVEETGGSTTGVGIVKVLSLGFQKTNEESNRAITSIKVSIPISLPVQNWV